MNEQRWYADVLIGAAGQPVVEIPALNTGRVWRYVLVAPGWYRIEGSRPL